MFHHMAYSSFLSCMFSLQLELYNSISILIGNPLVSKDSNKSSLLKQPSASASDGFTHFPRSHSALSDPLKTRNFALVLKIDNVTHWCWSSKSKFLLYSKKKVDLPGLCCWRMQSAAMCVDGSSCFLFELLTLHTLWSYLTSLFWLLALLLLPLP